MSRITLKTLADAAPKNKKILFEKKTIAAFEEIIDPDILAAVSKLEENEQQELLELAQKTLSGKTTAKEFLDKIGDLVGNIYHRNIRELCVKEIERSGVPLLFKSDLSGFNHAGLDKEYRLYIERRKAKAIIDKKPYKEVNALDFAIKTDAKGATGDLQRLFGGVYGPYYRTMLRTLKQEKMIIFIPEEALIHFDEMYKKGFGMTDYATMSLRNKTYGIYFESDHMFEKRFLNPANVVTSYDEGSILAVLVPKDSHIAVLMQKNVSEKVPPIKYVHKEKTRMMRGLIPHGDEHLYSVQYIWDAHMYTFEKLGLEITPKIRDNLKENFKIYIHALRTGGNKVPLPTFRIKVDKSQFEL